MRGKCSFALKLLTFVGAISGVILSMLRYDLDGYSHPTKRLFYFTGLSNIWIGVLMFFLLLLPYMGAWGKSEKVKQTSYVIKFVLTVSITLTALIFCTVLAPGSAENDYHAWTLSSLLTHVFVPLLAIFDFFLDEYKTAIATKHVYYTVIPPLLYFIFVTILILSGFDFGRGDPYPYFFLHFDSPAGIFGFSRQMPYLIGTFYWIIIMLGLILGIGFLYRKLYHLKKE